MQNTQSTHWKAYGFLLLASLLWAGNTILGRGLATQINPLALSFWRWYLALSCILVITARHLPAHWPEIKARWKTLVALSIFGVVGYNAFQYWSLQYSPAINIALVASAIPVVILPLSVLVLGVRPGWRAWLGVAISLSGVLLVIARGDAQRLASLSISQGDGIMFIAVLSWGVYTMILRKYPLNMPTLVSLTLQITLGTLILLPGYLLERHFTGDFTVQPQLLGALFYLAICPSILSYMCWDKGVTLIGAPAAGIFINFIPVFAALLAVLFLGEHFHWYHATGLALLMGGVLLINKK